MSICHKQITWYRGVILSSNPFARLIEMPSKKKEVVSVLVSNGKAEEAKQIV